MKIEKDEKAYNESIGKYFNELITENNLVLTILYLDKVFEYKKSVELQKIYNIAISKFGDFSYFIIDP